MKNKRTTVNDLAVMVGKGFAQVDKRFEETNKRMEEGFTAVDKRFEQMVTKDDFNNFKKSQDDKFEKAGKLEGRVDYIENILNVPKLKSS